MAACMLHRRGVSARASGMTAQSLLRHVAANFDHSHRNVFECDIDTCKQPQQPPSRSPDFPFTTLYKHSRQEGRQASWDTATFSSIAKIDDVSFHASLTKRSSAFSATNKLRSELASSTLYRSRLFSRVGGVRSHTGHSHGGGSLSELGVSTKEEGPGGEAAERMMRIGLAADIVLTVGKGAAGYVSGSTAIIADAAHSLSDIVRWQRKYEKCAHLLRFQNHSPLLTSHML